MQIFWGREGEIIVSETRRVLEKDIVLKGDKEREFMVSEKCVYAKS